RSPNNGARIARFRLEIVSRASAAEGFKVEQGRDGTPLAKKRPTVAFFNLDQQSHDTLRDCFTQFNIDVLAADESILKEDKLEGCVVSLNHPAVEETVAQARNSSWQRRMVIYAIGPASQILGLT